MGSGGGSPGRASTTTSPEQNELSFRTNPPSGGEVRNLHQEKQNIGIKKLHIIYMIPDTQFIK